MRFIPDYQVSYKGVFYDAEEEFDIDPADAEEMKEHGEVVEESAPPAELEESAAGEKPKRGRPRRQADGQP